MILATQIPDPSPDFSWAQANLWWLVLVFLAVMAGISWFIAWAYARRLDDK